ncbi:MAG: SDR family oxidoreductase [Bryobacteraceae bacterium]|jgi:NAD(P)-dependent dehydrogenase (short-subunit alcohol dehydrogenase family)
MERFLEGKTALVTGGTRGIGRAITEALLHHGASVAICGRTAGGVERAVAELRNQGKAAGRAADVANPDDVAALFRWVDEQLGGLDILINNAGVGAFSSVADTSIEQWRRIVGTNLDGLFYCSREALSRFRQRGGGFVINISSLAGKNPFAGGAAYNASKFGVNGFSEAMMLDHRYENVRVCYVMPGSVDTEFGAPASAASWKIAPQDIAEVVIAVLHMPERTLISRVEIRPSKPKKS